MTELQPDSGMEEGAILPGRACGSCTLCCKLMGINELDKPPDQWCAHCAVGKGCRIYAERPPPCRSFLCGYLAWPIVGEHWFPARSKMVLMAEEGQNRIVIHVDPSRPNAWRDRPYYDDIKQWSALVASQRHSLMVMVGGRSTVIFPDREVELGIVAEDERILISQTGGRWDAVKLKAGDPRLGQEKAGGFKP